MPENRGSAWTVGCRADKPGGRSSARRCAPIRASPWGSTSAPPAARFGRARTRASSSPVSPAICPKSTRSRRRRHEPISAFPYRRPMAHISMQANGNQSALSHSRDRFMKVYVPTPLSSYTQEATTVDATGRTLGELLDDLERRYPGIRFRIISEQDRIRRHIRIFVNLEEVRSLAAPLRPSDEVMIVGALSGG